MTEDQQKLFMIFGGVTRMLMVFRGELIKDFVKRGYRVVALGGDEPDDQTQKFFDEHGVEFRQVPLNPAMINPLSDLIVLWKVRRIVKELKPTLFLGYTVKPVVYGSIAARLGGCRNVFSLITGLGYVFTSKGLKQTLIRFFVSNLYRLALLFNRSVIFQNSDDRQTFVDAKIVSSNKAIVIRGSGVDTDHFAQVSLPEQPIFLIISRLLRDKGVGEYVEAAKAVKKKLPAARFLLVGDFYSNYSSFSKMDLDRWIQEGSIEYLGYLNDVRDAIAKASVYVLPSYREGLPRSVLEAMSMGRPVITTDAPGCRETVEDQVNGFLVPVRDSDVLSQKMEYFFKHPEAISKMGKASREKVLREFDVKIVNKQLLNTMGVEVN